ncbi:hypothetical protein HG536_0B02350 [Torulaspora globosa]|uniref:Anaphase-promoting complex subunit 4-like WD40 domain-containing protein n=1 Tax=Torulaspora globosa TaxID=48254 RepID=A0A7G3ZCY6_9SACH|nr:uncharacterized protein HG536_0B02350 [Torulaspora globosa]QLL31372.1 hypothetical protein HG536_0B02350 [Torulaspora globosa]
MSISSEELNYLIWRYLQENGKEVSALALQDETRVLDFDRKYSKDIPFGTLVNLVQKGILYTECDLLVEYNGEMKKVDEEHFTQDFNLAQALQVEKEKGPDRLINGRFALESDSMDEQPKEEDQRDLQRQEEGPKSVEEGIEAEGFIKTLKEFYKLGNIVSTCWNPVEKSMLAVGEKHSQARIYSFDENSGALLNEIELKHPFAPTSPVGNANNELSCLAWSPNGMQIVTAVENGELRLWNRDGSLQNVFNFHRSPIVCIKWNKDSAHFITADVDNVTVVWNATTGTAIQHFELKASESSGDSLGVDLEWVEIDKFIIPGPQGSLVVHQIGESKPVGRLVGHQGAISALQFNPGNKMLLSASDDHTVRVWRGGSSNPSYCFLGHSQSVVSVDWVDDKRVLSASMDGSVRLWSLADNSLLAISVADGVPVFSARLSQDKNKYAVGFVDGQVIVYDMKSLLASLDTRKRYPIPLSFPIYGTYQSPTNGDNVFDLSWAFKSDKVAVAFSTGQGSILCL